MALKPGLASRFAILAFFTTSTCVFLALFFFPTIYADDSWETYIPKVIRPSQSKPTNEIYSCDDPYRRPGYLYIDQEDYQKTRWLPYTDDILNADAPESAQYPASEEHDVKFEETDIEDEFLRSKSNPQSWMTMAVAESKRRTSAINVPKDEQKATHFAAMKEGGDLGWLWGRRVLMLGDSVDRFMTQYFCEEFGSTMRQPQQHTTATCSIPSLNLTLTHWHYAGSFTYRPQWWWMKDMQEIPFEERWQNLWGPMVDSLRGPEGRPDLVLWQNGLWDERALWENGEAHYNPDELLGQRQRQLVWQEVRFITARVKKLVQRISSEFGPDVPTMFRAFTLHRESDARDANLYELERVSRAVAEQAGHEMFEWGRLISGFSMLYKDQTHPGKGPASWLWSNMMLEYLARGAGKGDEARKPYFDGWQACHSHLSQWGGR